MKKHGLALVLKTIMVAALFAGFTTSCSRSPEYIMNPEVKHLSTVEIKERYAIEQAGIQVVKQGMKFTFIIPVDTFFDYDSGELKPSQEKALDTLTNFIRNYLRYFDHPRITITGYIDTVLLNPSRDKHAQYYADTVADHFQANGIANDYLQVRNGKTSNLVGSNEYPMGASFNRRVTVEIH